MKAVVGRICYSGNAMSRHRYRSRFVVMNTCRADKVSGRHTSTQIKDRFALQRRYLDCVLGLASREDECV